MGADFLAGEVADIAGGEKKSQSEAAVIIAEIEQLLAEGRSEMAVRCYRNKLGQTWSDALDAIEQWETLPHDRRVAQAAQALAKSAARANAKAGD